MSAIKTVDAKYAKIDILKSKKFVGRKDVLTVILNNEKQYTIDEVEKLIDSFMKGKVK